MTSPCPKATQVQTAAVFTVNLSAPANESLSINYTTANVSAEAGSDYAAANGVLTFAAGDSTKTITVNVAGDTTLEGNEQFTVTLNGASSGLTIGDAVGVGQINNDDQAPNRCRTPS